MKRNYRHHSQSSTRASLRSFERQTVKVTFSDGTSDIICTYGGARQRIADRCNVPVDSLVYETGEDRELVWLDEASAANDDGAKAVAEIREA
jgi:hypothetical protein